MARRKIDYEAGKAAFTLSSSLIYKGEEPDLKSLMTAVRFSLEELAERFPGRAVEIRIPPAGAVQILSGTTHRRGTPPAVVECDMHTWIRLCDGTLVWKQALEENLVNASGERTNLETILPMWYRFHEQTAT
ncbi:hypothetical protein BSR28_05220 [Boudabousia liubingyangii]|uniref:sterol carrier family protein n=1 Tax=Boudabousia liubingyangii TaxID=1921764 RepID=UPI000939C8B5|nr:sterol carrier family protein [Boudabousia liubingyangii]OKL46839.1 hypothetical protein BSR28_05220 [Boudabousia liubingyangii]